MDQSSSHHHQSADRQPMDGHLPEPQLDNPPTLPEAYWDNKLVFLPRDPFWFFAYWETTDDHVQIARHEAGLETWEAGVWILRIFDVTETPSNGVESASYFDVLVQQNARQWYIKSERAGRTYIGQWGRRLPDGRFIKVLQSNRIRLPNGRVSDKTDSQWMALGVKRSEEAGAATGAGSPRQFDELIQRLASNVNEASRGSVEIAKTMAKRWEFLRSVFSGSWPSSSGGMPSSSSYNATFTPSSGEETK